MTKTILCGEKTTGFAALYHRVLLRLSSRVVSRNSQNFPQLAVFSFDHVGLIINLYGRYEADIFEILGEFLSKTISIDFDSTALDVGYFGNGRLAGSASLAMRTIFGDRKKNRADFEFREVLLRHDYRRTKAPTSSVNVERPHGIAPHGLAKRSEASNTRKEA